jgi:hypothetical protein
VTLDQKQESIGLQGGIVSAKRAPGRAGRSQLMGVVE